MLENLFRVWPFSDKECPIKFLLRVDKERAKVGIFENESLNFAGTSEYWLECSLIGFGSVETLRLEITEFDEF